MDILNKSKQLFLINSPAASGRGIKEKNKNLVREKRKERKKKQIISFGFYVYNSRLLRFSRTIFRFL